MELFITRFTFFSRWAMISTLGSISIKYKHILMTSCVLIPLASRSELNGPVFPVAGCNPPSKAQAAAGLYIGSCTSANFVIDTVKADRAKYYADQEIRIPPRVVVRRARGRRRKRLVEG